jgi:small subunit ribosomal protein S1
VCGTYALTKDERERERERERMCQLFDDASERCRTAPMDGVAFSPDDLDTAVESTDIDTEIGSLVTPRFLPYSIVTTRSFSVGVDSSNWCG